MKKRREPHEARQIHDRLRGREFLDNWGGHISAKPAAQTIGDTHKSHACIADESWNWSAIGFGAGYGAIRSLYGLLFVLFGM